MIGTPCNVRRRKAERTAAIGPDGAAASGPLQCSAIRPGVRRRACPVSETMSRRQPNAARGVRSVLRKAGTRSGMELNID